MYDPKRMGRSHLPFIEAKDRLPSSVGQAEAWYLDKLRKEQIKNSTAGGQGLLDQSEQPYDGALNDLPYQRVYQPTMDYIKSHVSHIYQADKTVAT